jgi:regulator of sirC expression with transglutaminase-like and TPR domain
MTTSLSERILSEDVRAEWSRIAALGDDEIDLAVAALVLGRDVYPDLDIPRYIRCLDECAERVREDIAAAESRAAALMRLNEYLFEEEGYSGNTADYYDPRNSYLNEVIDRHLGIPITLCVLYLEIAGRVGLPVTGVSFPGHFLVQCPLEDGQVVLDPFSRGISLGIPQLDSLLRQVFGDAAPSVRDAPQLLQPATSRHILVRILRNLKAIHRNLGEEDRELVALERILILDPDAAPELRERAELFERHQCFAAAWRDLARYRELRPDGDDIESVDESLRRLRHVLPSYH